MMNITTKQFQILSDIDLVWNFLTDIYVREGVRQQGIARRLLSACENWAQAKGCTEFASDCELDNKDSQLFHQAVGFEEANRIVAYVKKL